MHIRFQKFGGCKALWEYCDWLPHCGTVFPENPSNILSTPRNFIEWRFSRTEATQNHIDLLTNNLCNAEGTRSETMSIHPEAHAPNTVRSWLVRRFPSDAFFLGGGGGRTSFAVIREEPRFVEEDAVPKWKRVRVWSNQSRNHHS